MELEYYSIVEENDDGTVTVEFEMDGVVYEAEGRIVEGNALIDEDTIDSARLS